MNHERLARGLKLCNKKDLGDRSSGLTSSLSSFSSTFSSFFASAAGAVAPKTGVSVPEAGAVALEADVNGPLSGAIASKAGAAASHAGGVASEVGAVVPHAGVSEALTSASEPLYTRSAASRRGRAAAVYSLAHLPQSRELSVSQGAKEADLPGARSRQEELVLRILKHRPRLRRQPFRFGLHPQPTVGVEEDSQDWKRASTSSGRGASKSSGTAKRPSS